MLALFVSPLQEWEKVATSQGALNFIRVVTIMPFQAN
jgi:hypothetical protein